MTFDIIPKENPEDDPDFDPTIFGPDWREKYMLESDDWKFDAIPEIIDGKNIADYVDPDILQRLDELEREEDERLKVLQAEMDLEEEVEELTPEDKELLLKIKEKKKKLIQTSRLNKQTRKNKPVLPRTSSTKELSDFASHLKEMGIDEAAAVGRARSRSRVGRKRKRDDDGDVSMGDVDEGVAMPDSKKKKMSLSRSRSLSQRSLSKAPVATGEGFKNQKHKDQAEVLSKKSHKLRNRFAKAGEGDRAIPTKMPKHLFSGKRGQGKTQRR